MGLPLRVFGHATARVENAIAGLLAPRPNGPSRFAQDGEMEDVARQLTAPLSVLSGYAEALGSSEASGLTPDQRLDVSRIHASCYQARAMMDGLLTIARLEEAGPRGERAVVDPCAVLNEAVVRATPVLRDKRLALGAEARSLRVARMDRAAVEVVLDNLIAALVPRVACGAELWTSLEREPTDLVLRLSVGTREDEVTELGFRSEDPVPARADHRCGMAFLIAARVVELLGGRLTVEQAPGSHRAWCARIPA